MDPAGGTAKAARLPRRRRRRRTACAAWCGSRASPPSPKAIAAYGAARGRARRAALRAARRRRAKGVRDRARSTGVADRDAAERAARAAALSRRARRCRRPRTRNIYHADLIGLAAALGDGTALGAGAARSMISAPATVIEIDARRRASRCWCRSPARPCRWSTSRAAGSSSIRPPGLFDEAAERRRRRRRSRHDLAGDRADDLSRRCFRGRSAIRSPARRWTRGCGGSKRWTSAISRATSTAPSTTRRSAAGRAW